MYKFSSFILGLLFSQSSIKLVIKGNLRVYIKVTCWISTCCRYCNWMLLLKNPAYLLLNGEWGWKLLKPVKHHSLPCHITRTYNKEKGFYTGTGTFLTNLDYSSQNFYGMCVICIDTRSGGQGKSVH